MVVRHRQQAAGLVVTRWLPRLMALLIPALVLMPAAAQAHPFGPPQTVKIRVDPANPAILHVTWKPGGIDDLVLLRDFLRDGTVVVPTSGPSVYSITLGESVEVSREFRRLPAFKQYMLSHITATSGGQPCPGTLEPIESLPRDGATVTLTCPAAVTRARIVVKTLIDLHPAYKTFATGPAGLRAVYDDTHVTHDWSIHGPAASGTVASAGRSAAIQLSIVGVGLLVVGGTAVVLVRHFSRKDRTA